MGRPVNGSGTSSAVQLPRTGAHPAAQLSQRRDVLRGPMQPVVHVRRQMGQQWRPALPHQCEELRGFQADVARNFLEPFRAVARLALRQQQRRLARRVVALERRLDIPVFA